MTGLFYLVLFVLVMFVVGFVGYYGWRLLQLRGESDESSRRMQRLLQETRSAVQPGPIDGHPSPSPIVEAASARPAPAGLPSRVYERTVHLGALSPNPVFLRREKSGEVTVQIDTRPPMPLKYVLDARARQALQEVATVASLDLGERWSVLASEDESGRLVLTRLT